MSHLRTNGLGLNKIIKAALSKIHTNIAYIYIRKKTHTSLYPKIQLFLIHCAKFPKTQLIFQKNTNRDLKKGKTFFFLIMESHTLNMRCVV